MATGANFVAGLPAADWRGNLGRIVNELAATARSGDETSGLLRVLEGCDTWADLPGDTQVVLVTWFAAQLRALQVKNHGDERLDSAVRRLSAYQKRQQSGFVHGLARMHRPKAGSWEEDAAQAWVRLREFLPSTEPPPKRVQAPAPQAKAPRVVPPAVENDGGDDDDDDDDDNGKPDPIPNDWQWRAWTQGRRAVIVGGDPREPNRQKLEDTFGFSELVWERSERTGRNAFQQIRERVRSGKLDMVLVLTRFIGHKAEDVIQPACKDTGVAFVPVQTGYGVGGIRRAIERHLAPMAES